MTKQEKLAKEKEAQVASALKASDDAIINEIEKGKVKEATAKKATAKASKKESKKASDLFNDKVYGPLSKDKKKAFRTKVRKKRNKLLKGIIEAHKAKKVKDKKALIADFISFYKESYALNDFSPLSLHATNADDDTKAMIKEALGIIKRTKIK